MTNKLSLSPSVYLLALGYGLGTTVAVISLAMSGLIGAELAPHPALSTLPYGLQFVGVMLSALFSSLLQARFGRQRIVFAAGCLGVLAGVMGVLALHIYSFILLSITHFLLGFFLANTGLLRFAALDLSPKALHGKALSMVMFGGTFASILGPFISRNAGSLFERLSVYQVSYLAISVIAVIIAVMVLFLHFPALKTSTHRQAIPLNALFSQRLYWFAVACGGIAYSLMNLIMINTSIQMKADGFAFNTVSYYIQVHVLAMFMPSLFNIKVLDKLGISRFLALGLVLQLLVSVVFLWGQNPVTFMLSLLLLGLSWNILYTSGSYIVGHLFDSPEMKFKAQGINDLCVAFYSAVGSLSAGVVLGLLGWHIQHLIAVVITLCLVVFYLWVRKQLNASS